ncbi:F-box protein At3g57590-like [Papaver somniferum]|uniref:F-box protein At3g57590-like n=1 Tax=Papaver somniferum TaxID=3469 RepID=UPI000E705FD8|nr:F-box protein At3g57590-like [Papaver somniferum]
MDYFKFLPLEIKLDIFTRVPAESVLDCKSVCSNWLGVVRHPLFSKMHIHRHLNRADDSGMLSFIAYSSDDEKFHYFECTENYDESTTPVKRIKMLNLTSPFKESCSLVGSSNGLICLEAESVCICNPITREYVMLPQLKKTKYSYVSVAGFGYVSSTREYKVVGIRHEFKTESAELYVYTLGSGKGWRKLTSQLSVLSDWDGAGIFADGALYRLDSELQFILTFDLAEEKFCEHLSLPPLPQDSDECDHGIGVLNGFLYFGVRDEMDGLYNVWLLKKKIDNHDMEGRDERQSLGWSKEFKVDGINLLAITKSKCVLNHASNRYLNIYDAETSTSKRLVKFKNGISEVYPHKNTLVSLKELGEEDTKTMESVGIEETRSSGSRRMRTYKLVSAVG